MRLQQITQRILIRSLNVLIQHVILFAVIATAFSSTWVKDINNNGSYQDLQVTAEDTLFTPMTVINCMAMVNKILCRRFQNGGKQIHKHQVVRIEVSF